MFSSCSGPGPTFGRCCAHWSLGETRSGRRLPAAPHACECEALDRGNKGSKMRTVSFLVSSSQDMDHAGVWPSVRAVRSAVRGPPTRRWYRVPALLRRAVLPRFGEGGRLLGQPVSQPDGRRFCEANRIADSKVAILGVWRAQIYTSIYISLSGS